MEKGNTTECHNKNFNTRAVAAISSILRLRSRAFGVSLFRVTQERKQWPANQAFNTCSEVTRDDDPPCDRCV